METIDISILPNKAKKELVDFFEFLTNKYKNEEKKQITRKERLIKIFNKSKGVLPKGYKFNRDEAHDR